MLISRDLIGQRAVSSCYVYVQFGFFVLQLCSGKLFSSSCGVCHHKKGFSPLKRSDWLWDELNLRNNPFCLLTLEEFVLLFVVSSLTEHPKTIRAVAALLKTVFPKVDVWRLQYNFLLNDTGNICFTHQAYRMSSS